ncbi:PspC domain-containing protein [Actinoplanes sp. NPDC023714]|uniref:PspC domain-containing protein n=1 Tax=Actinoplanes sp. NPDC023714 TaxID=3154322 RepID=UPI0033CBE272
MNDEAAGTRGPSTPGAGPQGATAPSSPQPDASSGPQPPPPGAESPYGANVPPWLANAGAAFARQQLVRPRNGRYVAGVCGALARATNTDPVLWRVLLGVLGILGGTGVLLYLIGWLIIPSEGDTASPVESLLGKGHSGMAPLSVVLLGSAALLTFAFIVNSGARASMLAAAVVLGAFLLIKRGGVPNRDGYAPAPGAAPPPPPAPVDDPTLAFTTPPAAGVPGATAHAAGASGATAPTATPSPATAPAATTAVPATTDPATTDPAGADPTGTAAADRPTVDQPAAPGDPVTPAPPRYEPPLFSPPAEGYRPPFAPHGPFAGSTVPPAPPAPAKPPKPPKPPRERSVLGRLTFFAVVVVMGLLAVLDMAGVNVVVSAYFAAALATIAVGLIVGAWFGRARGLIALALIATMGLFVSTGTERWGGEFRDSVYRPANLSELADQYDFTFGNVTLDLRDVDFAGAGAEAGAGAGAEADQLTTVNMKVGQLRVLLPPEVDTTVDVSGGGIRTVLFGTESAPSDNARQTVTDLGRDGTGGGNLRLDLRLDTGNLEVAR